MHEQGLDALLASTLHNIFYVSGFWNDNLLTVPRWTHAYAVAVREELATPTLVTSIGDAAAVLTACPAGTQTSFFGFLSRSQAPNAQLDAAERRIVELAEKAASHHDALHALATTLEDRELTKGVVGY